MARNAESLTFSMLPDDRARWSRHERERAQGRSDLLRHAMDLLDRESVVNHMRQLQDIGDAATAAQGLSEDDIAALIRESLSKSVEELNPEISQLVELIAGDPVDPPKRQRQPLPRALTGQPPAHDDG